jgi:glycosyltransferase involved in cell wall biosynthesis
MRVGIDLGDHPAEIGGGYTFTNEILGCLLRLRSETRHKFIIFHRTKEPPQVSAEHIQYISLYRSPIKRLVSRAFRLSKKIIHKVRRSRNQLDTIDWLQRIVLSSGVEIIWNLTPFTCITMEIPYITVVWDLQHRLQPYFPEVSAEGSWSWRESAFATLFRRASVVIAGTEAGKTEIEYFYQVPGNRIRILPHPTPRFALDAPSGNGAEVLNRYSIPEGYLFYPAQFWPHKNHAGLLLAAQLLRDKYNLVFPLVFVGSDRGNYKHIRELADTLDLSAQVYFLGFVPQEDLISLYRKAFALTYVTFFGPENLPPLEAFALGCPVIASNVEGAQEQLGDAAVLVEPKDPRQIACAVKALHDDVTWRQTLIQRGLKRARRFTGEDFVNGILSVLDDFELVRRCWTSKRLYHQILD